MKYYFPLHLNGGNRGCEAIAKGTSIILGEPKNNLIGLCSDINLDRNLGVDKYVTLVPLTNRTKIQQIDILLYKLFHRDQYERVCKGYHVDYDKFLDNISDNDVMVSTGGDMMCYKDNQVVYTINKVSQRRIKSILFACSMGEANLTLRKLEALKKFDILYARESLTESFFKSIGLKNVICYPDPAFILEPEKIKLPSCFEKKEVIGINVSRMIIKDKTANSPILNDLHSLIRFLLHKTDVQILLIPHVLWDDQDDRVLSNIFYNQYKSTGRLQILDSAKYNYCEIRHIISKCKVFIGARTHSVISAYSTCVPALALGYSIKSRGIAKDLWLDERLIVNCKNYEKGKLRFSFDYLMENENKIRQHLQIVIPEYKKRLKEVRDVIKNKLK